MRRIQINTLEELYAEARADLGPMDKGTYASFMERASELGVVNPVLALDVKVKRGVQCILAEGPKVMTEDCWGDWLFFFTTPPYSEKVEFVPKVHVLDGDQFTALRT